MKYISSRAVSPLAAMIAIATFAAGSHASSIQPPSGIAGLAAASVDPYQKLALDAGRDLIGKKAPDLVFKTLDGRRVKLGGHRARPIYLKFWATWCVTCRAQMPAFKADYARYGADIDIVAVNTGVNDDLASVRTYLRELPLPMPVAIDDGRLGKALHLRVTPQHVIIGRDGVIRYVGHLEDAQLQAALKSAVAGGNDPNTEEPRPSIPSSSASTHLSVQGGVVNLGAKPRSSGPRLVYFLSPWCEGYLGQSRPAIAQACLETRRALMQLASDGRADVVGISSALSTDAEGVRRFLKRTGFNAPVVLDEDGGLFRRFGVRSFPTVLQLDTAGRPIGRLTPSQVKALAARAAS